MSQEMGKIYVFKKSKSMLKKMVEPHLKNYNCPTDMETITLDHQIIEVCLLKTYKKHYYSNL